MALIRPNDNSDTVEAFVTVKQAKSVISKNVEFDYG
jgi:hypothetical protein